MCGFCPYRSVRFAASLFFMGIRFAITRISCRQLRWRQSSVPAFLSPEQEESILAATDRSTATGRRDYAILLLLARLGLRAGEIVALELGDIR